MTVNPNSDEMAEMQLRGSGTVEGGVMGYNGPPGYKPERPSVLMMLVALAVFAFLCYGLGQSYKRDVLDAYQKGG